MTSSSQQTRSSWPAPPAALLGLLGLTGLALWLVPGLEAAAVNAATHPATTNAPLDDTLRGFLLRRRAAGPPR